MYQIFRSTATILLDPTISLWDDSEYQRSLDLLLRIPSFLAFKITVASPLHECRVIVYLDCHN